MSEIAGYTLITIGVMFDVFGCIGLVRFPDIYNRLQAGTKCVTLGTCLLLAGVATATSSGSMTAKSLICIVFILLTMPTGAHAIARGAHAFGVKLWDGSVIDTYAEDKGKQLHIDSEGV